MSLDLLIKNGTIVDGTGAPRYQANIGVKDGKIADIGNITDSAVQVIDANDLIVAPGFVDPHTHYDAQICWDKLVTPSSWHGVTSVIMGNCGVGLAPCKPEARKIAAWDLVNVEGIPFDVLSQGVTWDWETFPDYLNAASKRGSAINVGFMAPLTPFRHYVMGEESIERAATLDETREIAALIGEAVAKGAFGFTTSNAGQHLGYKGRPLACRTASREELKAYANALRSLDKGTIELVLTNEVSLVTESERELLDLLLTESGRKVTWLAVLNRTDKPEAAMNCLRDMGTLIQRGGIPQCSCRPAVANIDLRVPFVMGSMECWRSVFNRSPKEQIQVLQSPDFRAAFKKEMENPRILSSPLGSAIIGQVDDPSMKHLEGRTVGDIASEQQKNVVDAFLDLAIQDQLRLQYTYVMFNADEARMPELITDPRLMIGLSDGGAHVDLFSDSGYCTYLLGHWVREKQALTLEHAVKRITSEPAEFYDIKQRGRIAKGLAADFAIFDPATVGSRQRGEMRNDLPGGGRRLVMLAQGVQYTIVNGTLLFEQNVHTGALPGQVLRSGQA